MSSETIGTIAAQLYAGGWRSDDRAWLKSYYELTDAETDDIVEMLVEEGMVG